MTFSELAYKRQSCRSFTGAPVPDAVLCDLAETARLAPSACNAQPWFFHIIRTPALLHAAAQLTQGMGMNKFTDQASALIVITEEPANLTAKLGGKIKDQQYAPIDIGLAAAHLCFRAEELGLGTCILGWFQEDKLRALLDLPAARRIRLVVAVGYPAGGEQRTKKRKDPDAVYRLL